MKLSFLLFNCTLCDILVKDYEKMAKQYENLAQVHKEMDKAADQ